METVLKRCARVAGALEDLAGQEAAAVRAGEFVAAAELQARSAPLVEFLARHADAADEAGVRTRVDRVLDQRRRTAQRVEWQIARLRDELRALGRSRRQLAQIGPAYGTGAGRTAGDRRFGAAG